MTILNENFKAHLTGDLARAVADCVNGSDDQGDSILRAWNLALRKNALDRNFFGALCGVVTGDGPFGLIVSLASKFKPTDIVSVDFSCTFDLVPEWAGPKALIVKRSYPSPEGCTDEECTLSECMGYHIQIFVMPSLGPF